MVLRVCVLFLAGGQRSRLGFYNAESVAANSRTSGVARNLKKRGGMNYINNQKSLSYFSFFSNICTFLISQSQGGGGEYDTMPP